MCVESTEHVEFWKCFVEKVEQSFPGDTLAIQYE